MLDSSRYYYLDSSITHASQILSHLAFFAMGNPQKFTTAMTK